MSAAPAYGQDESRGILAVNPYAEGSEEWHAWGLGYDYGVTTGGVYESPLSGEWADQMTPGHFHQQLAVLLDVPVLSAEYDYDELDEFDTAFEHGYAAYRAGWRV